MHHLRRRGIRNSQGDVGRTQLLGAPGHLDVAAAGIVRHPRAGPDAGRRRHAPESARLGFRDQAGHHLGSPFPASCGSGSFFRFNVYPNQSDSRSGTTTVLDALCGPRYVMALQANNWYVGMHERIYGLTIYFDGVAA